MSSKVISSTLAGEAAEFELEHVPEKFQQVVQHMEACWQTNRSPYMHVHV